MLTSSKSRLVSLLVFILTLALLVCSMSISVFADVAHDHDNDGVADHTDEEHEEEKESLWDKIKAWFDSDVGQIVGFSVAGVILVAFVIFVIWWIPKKDKKEKNAKKEFLRSPRSRTSFLFSHTKIMEYGIGYLSRNRASVHLAYCRKGGLKVKSADICAQACIKGVHRTRNRVFGVYKG